MRAAGLGAGHEAGRALLLGREAALAGLREAVLDRRPVAIVGEAGVGKSSLARAAVAASGRTLHEGGGFATLSWLPYLALRRAVDIAESDVPMEVAATVQDVVGTGALFIDDLQWADQPTREVVDLLMWRIPLVVAVRSGDPGAPTTIGRFEAGGGTILSLEGLDHAAAMALARRLLPDADPTTLERTVADSRGNPLLLEELAAHGEAPSWLVRAIGPGRTRVGAGSAARGNELRRMDRSVVATILDDLRAGRLADAAAGAGVGLDVGDEADELELILALGGLALALLGHAEEGEDMLGRAEALAAPRGRVAGTTLSCWAEASLWSGRPRQAIHRAEAALRVAESDDDQSRALVARSWAEVELGREPAAGAGGVRTPDFGGAKPELRALAALARGAFRHAAATFDEAAAAWASSDVPRELTCRWAAAEARRRAGDPGGAVAPLRDALRAATAIGFEPLAARTRRSLRLAGERLPGVAAGPRRSGGILTGRERQILELVERGRTNAEIARRMGLGRPTVARLLSNAMVKLGAESRAHAVILAASQS